MPILGVSENLFFVPGSNVQVIQKGLESNNLDPIWILPLLRATVTCCEYDFYVC